MTDVHAMMEDLNAQITAYDPDDPLSLIQWLYDDPERIVWLRNNRWAQDGASVLRQAFLAWEDDKK